MLDLSAPLVFTIDDLCPESERDVLVARIEALGPTAAPISIARGFVMRPDIRNNTRVMFDDPHYDGAFQRSPSERSELTFMVYLPSCSSTARSTRAAPSPRA